MADASFRPIIVRFRLQLLSDVMPRLDSWIPWPGILPVRIDARVGEQNLYVLRHAQADTDGTSALGDVETPTCVICAH